MACSYASRPCFSLDGTSCTDIDAVAIDCEMVAVTGRGARGIQDALCKVSLVSLAPGGCAFKTLLNTWVTVDAEVVDYRTAITGLDAEIARKLPSIPYNEARDIVRRLIAGKIVVGHALENDFRALAISHPLPLVRDTATQASLLPPGRINTPSLRLLAKYWLNEDMHSGAHDSMQDAKVALRLYMMHAEWWQSYVRHDLSTMHVFGSWVAWGARAPETTISLGNQVKEQDQQTETLKEQCFHTPPESCASTVYDDTESVASPACLELLDFDGLLGMEADLSP